MKVYIEPKNPWRKSDMATLWIGSYDPIIKCNLIKKEIIIEGTNSSELMLIQFFSDLTLEKLYLAKGRTGAK